MIESTEKVLATLSGSGLLLLQDKSLPNLVTLVTGETLSGSWWSHAQGGVIFAVLSELSDHPDVLSVKLVKKKVTLVHRRLWPALLTMVARDDPWQMKGLSAPARRLFAHVHESAGPVLGSGLCRCRGAPGGTWCWSVRGWLRL